MFLAGIGRALAATHYVDVNNTNATPPYTNWATAATNIQDAVDAAVAGDEVVVTNGIYASGSGGWSRVQVFQPMTIRSVNGAGLTVIDGGGLVTCAWLKTNATLSGFTLTNGWSYGFAGGVVCESWTAVVSNCVISGNQGYLGYGGSLYGGGAYGGTLNNCTLSHNVARALSTYSKPASAYGGGAYRCMLNNCTLIGNTATGVAFAYEPTAYAYGGGAYGCTLNNCILRGNAAYGEHDAGSGVADMYAYGGGACGCTLNNCTLVLNVASASGFNQPIWYHGDGYGAYGCTLNNSIAWDNYLGAPRVARVIDNWSSCSLYYCSTWPQPVNGSGNITNAPLFVDETEGNLRLQSNSPCINAGNNSYLTNSYFTNCFDLDGNPRIAGGTVDIGAYEFQSPVSQISYAWLQQYGLPINSSTDTADPDGDAVDNYHEWLAGTNPTNALSSPAQLTITPSPAGRDPGIILTWSTNAVGFTLQSTTNLLSPAAWVTNSSAPVMVNGQNTVTNPITGAQQFYRLIH